MDYKKKIKFITVIFIVFMFISTIIYYTVVSRAESFSLLKKGGEVESINLGMVLDYIKKFFKEDNKDFTNTASIIKTKDINKNTESSLIFKEKDLLNNSQLNRKLLDRCLARAENEWKELQKHYDEVLNECVILDLGLNGEKLFGMNECEEKINPYKTGDKNRIQKDKERCFSSYSKRQ